MQFFYLLLSFLVGKFLAGGFSGAKQTGFSPVEAWEEFPKRVEGRREQPRKTLSSQNVKKTSRTSKH